MCVNEIFMKWTKDILVVTTKVIILEARKCHKTSISFFYKPVKLKKTNI